MCSSCGVWNKSLPHTFGLHLAMAIATMACEGKSTISMEPEMDSLEFWLT